MPMVPQALIAMITKNVAENLKKVSGHSPLESKSPVYFMQMCKAIGTGIAGGTKVLNFETKDQGFKGDPPIPGAGTGMGIEIDESFMSEKIYTNIRKSILKKYKQTSHAPWPPPNDNSGAFLKAFSDGIAKAVKDHYKIAWVLTSVHPNVYSGSGKASKFKGVMAPAVKGLIVANKGMLKGEFFPHFAQGVAEGYQEAVEKTAKANITITGICIIITPPAGYQLCNIPANGKGNGAAI